MRQLILVINEEVLDSYQGKNLLLLKNITETLKLTHLLVFITDSQ